MKKLLVLMAVAFLMVPAPALAVGNANPHLYLEIYDFASDPDPVPDYVCICPLVPPATIQCYSDKTAGMAFGYLAVHVGKVENGYYGLPFGIEDAGGTVIFLSAVACPGFLKGPSASGEPGAIIISSTGECHQWRHHLGYLKYITSNTAATLFDIVGSADLGHYMVINCDNEYDQETSVGGRAQWGGVQDVQCQGDPTAVQLSTWGKIKSLYR